MPVESQVLAIGGYVLAGGHSSRMGIDKALLEFAGRPLIAHAVGKLRRACTEVHILAGEEPRSHADATRASALAAHAPLLYDLHCNCGPIAGIQAALTHSPYDWNLILPVDMPLLPAAFLKEWARKAIARSAARIALFEVGGLPQAMPLLIHRDVRAYISLAIQRGEYKLLAALEAAATHSGAAANISVLSAGGQERRFSNLNTPEEFAEAETHADVLDPL